MNGIQVDINRLKKGEVSLGTSMYVLKSYAKHYCKLYLITNKVVLISRIELRFPNILLVWLLHLMVVSY